MRKNLEFWSRDCYRMRSQDDKEAMLSFLMRRYTRKLVVKVCGEYGFDLEPQSHKKRKQLYSDNLHRIFDIMETWQADKERKRVETAVITLQGHTFHVWKKSGKPLDRRYYCQKSMEFGYFSKDVIRCPHCGEVVKVRRAR